MMHGDSWPHIVYTYCSLMTVDPNNIQLIVTHSIIHIGHIANLMCVAPEKIRIKQISPDY